MVPSALLSEAVGTAHAMATSRILAALASSAGVVLVGLLLRHQGLLAVIMGCGIVAVYPDSVFTARTVLVEPWLALFCLARGPGRGVRSRPDRLTSRRKRLLVERRRCSASRAAVEVMGHHPRCIVVAGPAACPGPGGRSPCTWRALAAGFLRPRPALRRAGPAPLLPEPAHVAQLGPRAASLRVSTRVPLPARLSHMLGISTLHLPAHPRLVILTATAVLVIVVAAMIAVAWIRLRQAPPALDWFALGTTAVVVVMFMWPDQFHYHFAAFLAPFFAMSIALPLSRFMEALGQGTSWLPAGDGRQLSKPAVVVAALVVPVLAMDQASYESHLQLRLAPVASQIEKIIPKGACVATDQTSYLLMANRFSPDQANCPHMLDGLGSDLGFSNGLKPATGAGQVPAVQAMWWDEFTRAQFVWLSYNQSRRVAWYPQLRAYFKANFVPVYKHGWHDTLWARKGAHTG